MLSIEKIIKIINKIIRIFSKFLKSLNFKITYLTHIFIHHFKDCSFLNKNTNYPYHTQKIKNNNNLSTK